MSKVIKRKNEKIIECPECEGTLKYLQSWEEAFDRYDNKLPSFYDVIEALEKKEEPKYKCPDCNTYIVVTN